MHSLQNDRYFYESDHFVSILIFSTENMLAEKISKAETAQTAVLQNITIGVFYK